jgi:hypothetical protein
VTVSAEAAAEMWSARRQRNLPPGISILLFILHIACTHELILLCFLFIHIPSDLGQKMLALVAWVTSKELALFRKFPEAFPSFIFIIVLSLLLLFDCSIFGIPCFFFHAYRFSFLTSQRALVASKGRCTCWASRQVLARVALLCALTHPMNRYVR